MTLDAKIQEGAISELMVYILTVYYALKLNKKSFKREKYSISKLMELSPNEVYKLAKDIIEFEGNEAYRLDYLLKEITFEEYKDIIAQKKKEAIE